MTREHPIERAKMEQEQKIEPVKILLADENPIFATGCALTLASYGIEVVGEGSTPADLVKQYDQLQPNVLVIDVAFGGGKTGFQIATDVLRGDAHARIVFLSQYDHDNLFKESYRIGLAFVTKDRDPADLAEAVSKANSGNLFFLPHIAEQMASLKVRGDDSPQDLLQGREIEIFKLMALGLTNLEIAERLGLSAKSISNYSQVIKDKLGVQRAAELTRMAVRHGLIEP
jgi:two-component system invasion response regulator UvrY